ncbi:tetratricopeptide repeat protein [Streptomyces sp. NPDC057638]|uniref:tetratricopeptide repeat protein n=1 Tax=Streptomyces sp. NPDC057638 TaxID=3346190 RepID=UPI003687EA0A
MTLPPEPSALAPVPARGPAASAVLAPAGADTARAVRTDNVMDGATVHGPAVQAGQIHGGLHLHPAAPVPPPVPRQIPPVPGTFTDRADDLRALAAWACGPGPAVRTVVLHGVPGVGKTLLAHRVLEHLADEFPGGQLQAGLHGPDGRPADIGEILGRLLRSLHTGPLPADTGERAAWWRSSTAARQPIALLLDHAADADQIRALLPGGRGHLVVATSRQAPADLARDGALLHPVTPFGPADARTYLSRVTGPGRLDGEPAAVRALVGMTAGLPLALGIAGAALVARPDRTVADTAAALTRHRPATAATDRFGAAVNAFLDHAYQNLPRPGARVHRLLGALFTSDTDPDLTAAVCSLTPDQAHRHLTTLATAGLLQHTGDHPARGPVFTFPTAARDHARRHARATETDQDEPVRRALDWYLARLTAAERLLTPTHRRLPRTYAHSPATPAPFTTPGQAAAWLTAHRDNLAPAVRTAATAGLHATCWQLVHALWPHLRITHDYAVWFETHDLGVTAARACGDRSAERELLNTWGIGLRGDGSHTAALARFGDVLALARTEGDQRAEAQALHDLGATHVAADAPDAALPLLEEARTLRTALAARAEADGDDDEARVHRRSAALTDTALGQVRIDQDRPQEAIGLLSAARTALLAAGDPVDAGRALAWLGRAHAAAGDRPAAVEAGRLAVEEFTGLRVPRWRARSLELLALTHLDTGRPESARDLLRAARETYTPISRRDAERVSARLDALPGT